ncbi:hypothetical protein LCGC14_3036800 [marine sediment metagenome]|uniref:Uncharacterized protein n=1 Tax=marine sediment metagenome TaxID=412755 RepID=A0A0F8WQI1_9ZZZZ
MILIMEFAQDVEEEIIHKMYRLVKCGYCEKGLGSYHRGDVQEAITKHFMLEHLDKWNEMAAVASVLSDLRGKYKFRGRLFKRINEK